MKYVNFISRETKFALSWDSARVEKPEWGQVRADYCKLRLGFILNFCL